MKALVVLLSLTAYANADLCVTKGALDGASIRAPTVRAFAPGTTGDAASLKFTWRGVADDTRALASGETRQQLGLKLRAQDSCNVIYVMWRLDTRRLDVSVKRNPGKRTHEECGAAGYSKVKPQTWAPVPALADGASHTLEAAIEDGILVAHVDGKLAWRGRLPEPANSLVGPAGLRSDNVKLDGIELGAPHAEGPAPACKRHGDDD